MTARAAPSVTALRFRGPAPEVGIRRGAAVALLMVLAAAAPQPQSEDTARLPGGTVLDTPALVALIHAERPVLIDVAPPPAHKPTGLPPGAPWMPEPHHDIPGSVWLPGVGESALAPARASWFHDRLAALAGGQDRPLVFYCHTNCNLSLNAAEHAIDDGYSRVYWYPSGVEGWAESGEPTVLAKPDKSDPAR